MVRSKTLWWLSVALWCFVYCAGQQPLIVKFSQLGIESKPQRYRFFSATNKLFYLFPPKFDNPKIILITTPLKYHCTPQAPRLTNEHCPPERSPLF